jgi:hypothetical protein
MRLALPWVAELYCQAGTHHDETRRLRLAGIPRQLPSKFGNFLTGRRPIRAASITVEHQRAGFQFLFEFFLIECKGLVVVVRTYGIEIQALAHEYIDGSAKLRRQDLRHPAYANVGLFEALVEGAKERPHRWTGDVREIMAYPRDGH